MNDMNVQYITAPVNKRAQAKRGTSARVWGRHAQRWGHHFVRKSESSQIHSHNHPLTQLILEFLFFP